MVQQEAAALDIHIEPIPGYSPDFMPVEHLWQWLREDVTYHNCYDSKAALIKQVVWFEQQINVFPQAICERLWVTTHLQPEQEKLRISP